MTLRKPVSAREYSPEFIACIADSKICLAVVWLVQKPGAELRSSVSASADLKNFHKYIGDLAWNSSSHLDKKV